MTSRGQDLIRRAAALVPLLRNNAVAAEAARRVPEASFEALSEAGIFRMMAPKRHGGDEADFQTQCDVLAEIGRGCPSTSWVATIFSAMGWLAGVFPDEAQDEVFEGRDPRISGVFSPTGTAVPKGGGFVVNGRWPFNTGCHGAKWTVLNAVVGEGAAGVPTCVLVKSRELKVLEDWHASGMAATGSNTIVAENVFVPAHRSLPLPEMI
ncbi:MAG: acyl-CoA dehydrogenase, partial [Acidobacteria bacterium]